MYVLDAKQALLHAVCCIGGAWRTVTLFIECHMASIRNILNS